MKIKFLILGVFFVVSGFAQSTIKFDAASYNYGKIKKGVHKSVNFNYTNLGNKPAVIEFANAECGCTQPEYDQKPILKGQKGSIKVTYTAGYSTCPADLRLAVIDLITYYLKEEHRETRTLGGASIQNPSSTSLNDNVGFPDHIKRVLDLYKVY